MFVVFLGPPGSGKGTQSRRLTEFLDVPHLSTGEMLRSAKREGTSVGALASSYMDRGELVPDPIVMNVLEERLSRPDCSHGCLFDGFPRTLGQAKSLDQLLSSRGTPLNVVIELKADENEIMRRMLHRAAVERRADDTPETIENRLRVYRQQTAPLVDYYFRHGLLEKINAMASPDEVFDGVRIALDNHRRNGQHLQG